MNNLLWAFAFVAISFVYNKEKFSFPIMILLFFNIFATIEVFEQFGLVILAGGFLFFYYIAEVILLTFTESVPSLQGKIPFILTSYFFVMFGIYTFFMA